MHPNWYPLDTWEYWGLIFSFFPPRRSKVNTNKILNLLFFFPSWVLSRVNLASVLSENAAAIGSEKKWCCSLTSLLVWGLNTDTKNTPNHVFIYDAQIRVFYFITNLNHINSLKHVITSKEPFSQAWLICNNLKNCCVLTLRNLLQHLKSHTFQLHHLFLNSVTLVPSQWTDFLD